MSGVWPNRDKVNQTAPAPRFEFATAQSYRYIYGMISERIVSSGFQYELVACAPDVRRAREGCFIQSPPSRVIEKFSDSLLRHETVGEI